MPAVHIRTQDMLSPLERQFLDAAEKGNRPSLESCLHQRSRVPLNINAVDAMGRTAIEIAVDNENVEIVQMLLQQPDVRIGNALLCAIREGVYEIVEAFINHQSITRDMLGEGWSKYCELEPTETATSEYSSDISPVILAAHLNQFEILQLLLRKDASIEKPHKHYCPCEVCEEERINDGLHRSLKRINTYHALASPAWISLTSSDPILSAFKLSRELQKRANAEDEFKDQYLQLAEQCKQYAVDLLSQCRSTEEVMAVLNKEDNFCNEEVDLNAAKCSLARLKLAIKYEQKTFVAHPHCQQLLTSIWYEGFPLKQHRSSFLRTILISLLLVLGWPVLAICYILMPKSRIGEIMRSPFMKFLYYSISFGCFLTLLTMVTFEAYREQTGEIKGGGMTRAADRGPGPTLIEGLVLIWVVGMLWSEMKQLWQEGVNKYVHQWWNWLDFAMLCLYLCTISIRVSAYLIYVQWNDGERWTPRHMIRTHWHAYEPMLVSEALFAVGNVFSFARIYYLFQTNPYLGPLQISLGCMLVDVAKFCIIFVLIISSFSIGLAQLYWYYDANTPVCLAPDQCLTAPNAFSSIANSYMTLLWSLFSITKVEDTDVLEAHHFTVWVGQGLFILYHMASIIVLLNMLIAMMSHSFERINDHADLEWKFHRSKLWMAHFDEGSTLSPPFNIIVTPKACVKTARRIINTVRWCFGRYQYDSKDANRATIRRPGYRQKSRELESGMHTGMSGAEMSPPKKPVTYTEIIQRLVSRFIHEQKKSMKMDGVNEDELKEIKQDISSLRFELRDDRRKEIVRSSSHIDAVKREIMRSMSTSTRTFNTKSKDQSAIARNFIVAERVDSEEREEDSDGTESRRSSLFTGISSTLSPTFSIPFTNSTRPSYQHDEQQQLLLLPPPPAITVATSEVEQFRYAEGQRRRTAGEAATVEFYMGGGYRSRPGGNGTGQRDSIRSDSLSERKKVSLTAKKSAPLGNFVIATNTTRSARSSVGSLQIHQSVPHNPSLHVATSMEAIQRVRDSINEQLDRLVEEIELQRGAFAIQGHRMSSAEEEQAEEATTGMAATEQFTTEIRENATIVREGEEEMPLGNANEEEEENISTKNNHNKSRGTSPSRVSFAGDV